MRRFVMANIVGRYSVNTGSRLLVRQSPEAYCVNPLVWSIHSYEALTTGMYRHRAFERSLVSSSASHRVLNCWMHHIASSASNEIFVSISAVESK